MIRVLLTIVLCALLFSFAPAASRAVGIARIQQDDIRVDALMRSYTESLAEGGSRNRLIPRVRFLHAAQMPTRALPGNERILARGRLAICVIEIERKGRAVPRTWVDRYIYDLRTRELLGVESETK